MRFYLQKILFVLVLITALGFSVLPHYGISWDEEATAEVVSVNYEIITQGAKNDHRKYHRQYYGTWFNVAAEVVFKAQQTLNIPSIPSAYATPLESTDSASEAATMLARLQSKHLFTFLISMVTYAATAGLVAILAGQAFAWLGPAVLFFIPRFWGNSFFNPKDIPLAALFTLGTLFGTLLIHHYFSSDRRQSIGLNATTGYSLAFGMLAGIVAGTRIDSSVLMLYVIAVDAGLQLSWGKPIAQVLKFSRFYGLMLLSGIATIVLLYPGSWANPLQWYLFAFNFYYKENWGHTVLFGGADIPADTLPWHYVLTWIGITTPVAILTLFGMGWILAALRYQQLSMTQRACLLMVSLQTFGLPVLAMLYQATLFDSLRQLLYVLPGIAVMAGVAIAWIYPLLPKLSQFSFVGVLLALSCAIALDMATLHPYEYTYFSRAFGGLPAAAERFDTDYWGLSMADAVRWINEEGDPSLPLVSTEPLSSANLLAEEDITVIPYSDLEDDEQKESFYYLSLPRWNWNKRFSNCPIVYGVVRQQVPLSIVRLCK